MYTDTNSLVDISFDLHWTDSDISHNHSYFAGEANLWRDFFPKRLYQSIIKKPEGYKTDFFLNAGELIPDYTEKNVHTVKNYNIDLVSVPELTTPLQKGRFYPRGILSKGFQGVFKGNVIPFRCLGVENSSTIADLNHPLSGIPLKLTINIGTIHHKKKERGGLCNDWIDYLTSGPGMQSRYKNIKPDLITKTAFQRDDELSDTLFYKSDRMVSHIDEQAQTVLSDLHGMLIQPGMSVLDLMSSWQTHIPKTLDLNELKGIGLNRNELSANPALTDYRVHDLNNDPTIPFPDKSFDVVICSLSIEYLVKPVEVFREVARILKPKGKFIVTFSNRWFPTKAIRLWKELHEFERVGLVTEYFLESGKFNSLNTFSHRGFPRPWEDKYFSESRYSDPIFGVTGKLAD